MPSIAGRICFGSLSPSPPNPTRLPTNGTGLRPWKKRKRSRVPRGGPRTLEQWNSGTAVGVYGNTKPTPESARCRFRIPVSKPTRHRYRTPVLLVHSGIRCDILYLGQGTARFMQVKEPEARSTRAVIQVLGRSVNEVTSIQPSCAVSAPGCMANANAGRHGGGLS